MLKKLSFFCKKLYSNEAAQKNTLMLAGGVISLFWVTHQESQRIKRDEAKYEALYPGHKPTKFPVECGATWVDMNPPPGYKPSV